MHVRLYFILNMKVDYTAFLASASGKLNGTVAARNKGGAYFRTKVTPINPKTSFQSVQRSYISDVAKAWAGVLTDDQRNSWTKYGESAGAKGVFGNGIILSGIAAYQKINQIVLTSGGARIDDPPISQNVPSVLSLSLVADSVGGTLVATFTPTPLAGPTGLYIFATPPVSAGISNVGNRLRFIGFFAGAASPLDITAEWVARLGTFPTSAGQRIAITAEVCDPTTGAISASFGAATLVI